MRLGFPFVGVVLFFISICAWSADSTPTVKVLRTMAHKGWSEGIDFHDGFIWQTQPERIYKREIRFGRVKQSIKTPPGHNESLTWFRGRLWLVSLKSNALYAGTLQGEEMTFEKVGSVPEVAAWGLSNDGTHLLVGGDHSSIIYFLNPDTLKVERQIAVPVQNLEDFAWDGKYIWASSFTDRPAEIFAIDPASGNLVNSYRVPNAGRDCKTIDGIAVNGDQLYVTGKNCPWIYVVQNPLK